MLLLPKKVGSYTLQRKLGTGGVAESYVGTHDTNGGRPVVVRRVLPYVLRDATRLGAVEGRVKDLLGVRHPFLVHVLESFSEGDEHYLVEEYIDGVNLEKVLAWCRQHQRHIPHNVFLNIATQVCNGLEALHGRTGKGTSAEHVLHLALKPNAVFVTRDGKVMLGGYGLTRSPTTLPHGGVAGPVPSRMEYLSPEQTHPDQKLTPASDIFSLGAALFELLTLDSLFRADSNLQTIHRVRRAEVTSQLLRVKELMPGLDKVLYRALSLNPRHRYQRAFVLREDLRGLMAGYSFATIAEDTRSFLAPLLETIAPVFSLVAAAQDAPPGADSFSETPITAVDLDPMATASAAAERRAQNIAQLEPVGPEDAGEHTESTSPRGVEDPPTEVHRDVQLEQREDLDRPTLPGHAFGDHGEGTLPVEAHRAPPDPTVSHPDLSRLPPPPPLQLAPMASVPPAPEPNSTAAWLSNGGPVAPAPLPPPPAAQPAPPLPTPVTVSPSDTAAFLVSPQPPAPPPVAPEGPPLSRPMPPPGGGPALSRPMPPPSLGAAPKPVAAPPSPPTLTPPAPPSLPLPASSASPTLTPPGIPPLAPPAPAPSAAQRPTAPPPPAPGPYEDFEPPPSDNRGWLLVGGVLAAMAAVFVCAGGTWFAWSQLQSVPDEAVAVAPAAAPATPTPGADAAAVMADEAPPRVEPITEEPVADAPVADAAPAPAPVEVAPTPTPAPVAATTPEPRPAATPSPSSTSSTSTSTAAPRSTASTTPATTSRSTASNTSAAPSTTTRTTGASTSSASTSTSRSSTPSSTATTSTSTRSTPAPAPTSTRTTTTTTAKADTRPVANTSRTAAPATFETPVDVSVEETPVSDLEQYVDAAKKGKLQSTDIAVLDMIDTQAPDYTRSRALLLMNAQRKGDDKATRRYLDELMLLPENQYNPVYLTDYARWHVNHAEYEKALDKASLAERYWARIPPELVFSKKAEIYEIQAAAWQGKFYKSDEDMEMLGSAIKGWERYRQHVTTKSRTDLQKRADAELARLQDIREKLQ